MLDGLRGEASIAELCRREGNSERLYYAWSKEFLEAGKRRLAGDTARAATSGEIKDLRREAQEHKAVVAKQALELRLLKKKHDCGWGRRGMRYPAAEKLEIIHLVEQSHLPVRRTLEKLGIQPARSYRWYDRLKIDAGVPSHAIRKALGSVAPTKILTAAPSVLSERHRSQHSADEITAVAAVLNARPRKTLGWKTPAEALDALPSRVNTIEVATTA